MENIFEFINNNTSLVILLAIVVIAWLIFELKIKAKGIDCHNLVALINTGQLIILDLRDDIAFNQGHIVNAINVPVKEIEKIKQLLAKYKDKTIILVSQLGSVPSLIVQEVKKTGNKSMSLSGGINNWQQQNLPLVTTAQKVKNKK